MKHSVNQTATIIVIFHRITGMHNFSLFDSLSATKNSEHTVYLKFLGNSSNFSAYGISLRGTSIDWVQSNRVMMNSVKPIIILFQQTQSYYRLIKSNATQQSYFLQIVGFFLLASLLSKLAHLREIFTTWLPGSQVRRWLCCITTSSTFCSATLQLLGLLLIRR